MTPIQRSKERYWNIHPISNVEKHVIGLWKSKQFLEKRGYQVFETKSKKNGIEYIAISQTGNKVLKIRTNTVSHGSPFPYGKNLRNLSDYIMLWVEMFDTDKEPQLAILTEQELKENLTGENKIKYLKQTDYSRYLNREDELIGTGFDD